MPRHRCECVQWSSKEENSGVALRVSQWNCQQRVLQPCLVWQSSTWWTIVMSRAIWYRIVLHSGPPQISSLCVADRKSSALLRSRDSRRCTYGTQCWQLESPVYEFSAVPQQWQAKAPAGEFRAQYGWWYLSQYVSCCMLIFHKADGVRTAKKAFCSTVGEDPCAIVTGCLFAYDLFRSNTKVSVRNSKIAPSQVTWLHKAAKMCWFVKGVVVIVLGSLL